MENWPLPPFYKDASASEELMPLDALLMNNAGIAAKGHLVRFSPARGTFAFTEGVVPVSKALKLSSLRSLHLSAPILLVPDEDLMALYREAGGQVAAPDARPFRVSFSDGEDLQGKTHGFVRTQYGVFLYLVTHDNQSIRVFVPESATASLQIGALLGDELVRAGAISRREVTLALGEQARRRKALIDEHCGDAPISDAETLAAVVKQRGGVPSQVRIADIIVNQGLASRDQLFEALSRMHKDKRALLGHILAEMGVITEERLAQAVAAQLGVPIVSVASFVIKPAVLSMVDSSFAVAHQVLPLLATERTLVVAVENPADAPYLDDLRFSTERQVIPVIAGSSELAARIATEYVSKALAGKAASIKREIDELGINLAREAANVAGSTEPRLVKETDTLLVRLVNNMIIYAHEQRASDIHVEAYPDGVPTRIRFRIDGALSEYLQLPSTLRSALISRLKIMADLDISEHRKPQDGKIDFQRFAPLKLELRVASLPTANGLEDVVMRLLSSSKPILLGELGVSDELHGQLKEMIHRTYGLILVCGPTGSGKTTTLHSLLAEVNTAESKIWTAEDPIEITQAGLRQIQMIPRAGLTFAVAMRAFLRADPDIIMVGEMRDEETTRIAIEASLTGHLVLSTLHTNSAPESVVRLLDLGLDPFSFSDALIGVLSQRLARRLCTNCKAPVTNPEDELRQLVEEYCQDSQLDHELVLKDWRVRFGSPRDSDPALYRPTGCEQCHQTGFRGRVGVYELMTATPGIKRLIQSRAPVDALFVQAGAEGMLRLKQYGIHTVLKGHTDIRSIRSACA